MFQINDVVFSLHACLATCFTCLQCYYLDRGHQTLSVSCIVYTILMAMVIITSVIMSITSNITWLTCLNTLSFIKLFITTIKYIPQVIMNYRCKESDSDN